MRSDPIFPSNLGSQFLILSGILLLFYSNIKLPGALNVVSMFVASVITSLGLALHTSRAITLASAE